MLAEFVWLLLILTIGLPFLLWFWITNKYQHFQNVPGPKPTPLLGNVLEMGTNSVDLIQFFIKYADKFDGCFKYYVGLVPRLCLSDPELMSIIWNSNVNIAKSGGYDLIKPWLGDGLLVSNGEKWRNRRKLITPSFHFKILDQFLSIFNSAADVFIEKLEENVDDVSHKNGFDLHTYVNLLSLDIICETAMGVHVNAQKGQHIEYVTAVKTYLNILLVRFFSIWRRYDFLFKWTSDYPQHLNSIRILHAFTDGVIRSRRMEIAQKKKNENNSRDNISNDTGVKRRIPLLDLLIESEHAHSLTDKDIREEIDTFMFEGHDTTTSGIEFGMLSLAQNPAVQQEVYQELEAVLGANPKTVPLTMYHMQQLQYLEMVVKEVQRMYPSVPMVEREISEQCTIGQCLVPKGTIISLFIYGLHHNAKYYPNPEIFDPQRFDSHMREKGRTNFTYVPFSAGARNCIGQKFAMLSMKTSLAKVVSNYKLLTVDGFEPQLATNSILRSDNGVYVRLVKR